MNTFNWLFPGRPDSDEDDPEYLTLYQVRWSEPVEREYTNVTERLVWSGGAEKWVTYTKEESEHFRDEFFRVTPDGDVVHVLTINESPAYREEVSQETVTYEETRHRYTWVSEVPPGVQETGKTKHVEVIAEGER